MERRMAAPSSYEGWAHALHPVIESRLADAEAELAFLRADNARVGRENVRLRGQCERLSAQVAELTADPETHARALRRGLMDARRGSDVDLASASNADVATDREDRRLSLFLTDGKGALTERRVPGIVSAPRGTLQFGVVQAEVTSTGFVGLRPLPRAGEGAGGGGTAVSAPSAPSALTVPGKMMKSLMKNVLGTSPVDDAGQSSMTPTEGHGTYEIVWKEGGAVGGAHPNTAVQADASGGSLRRLAFECDAAAFEYVREQISSWSDASLLGSADVGAAARHRRAGSNLTIDLAGDDVQGAGGDGHVDARGGEETHEKDEKDEEEESKIRGEVFYAGDGAAAAAAAARMLDDSSVVTVAQAHALTRALPARIRDKAWRLRYSTRRDGVSLRTMYRSAAGAKVGEFIFICVWAIRMTSCFVLFTGDRQCEESVLLVRTRDGESFGAFTTEHWRVAPRYYGTGESFVFQMLNSELEDETDGARVFRWTKRNDYFVFGRNECVAVGGGCGFALWLDEELLRGNSSRSDTFGNEPLSSTHEFEVSCVELWTFE